MTEGMQESEKEETDSRLNTIIERVSRTLKVPESDIFGFAISRILPSQRRVYELLYLTERGVEDITAPTEQKTIHEIKFWINIKLKLEIAARIRNGDDLYAYYDLAETKRLDFFHRFLCQGKYFAIEKNEGPKGAVAAIIPINICTLPEKLKAYLKRQNEEYFFLNFE